jgi:hypothetical protein
MVRTCVVPWYRTYVPWYVLEYHTNGTRYYQVPMVPVVRTKYEYVHVYVRPYVRCTC